MMPSCDQIGVPIHFPSSATSGSASLMSLRILPRVFPRQSPSSAILFEMSSDADWPWLAPDFFMFSSWKFRVNFIYKTVEDSSACREQRDKGNSCDTGFMGTPLKLRAPSGKHGEQFPQRWPPQPASSNARPH